MLDGHYKGPNFRTSGSLTDPPGREKNRTVSADLVLLDLNMPNLVVRRFKQLRESAPLTNFCRC